MEHEIIVGRQSRETEDGGDAAALKTMMSRTGGKP